MSENASRRQLGLAALGVLALACNQVGAPVAPSATAPVAGAPSALTPPMTVRVALVGATTDSGFLIAEKKGYFRDYGLNIERTSIPTGADLIALLGTDQIEVAGGALSPALFNAALRNIPFKLVADKGHHPPGAASAAFVVRKDLFDQGKVTDYDDLRGLTIAAQGATAGSSNVVMLDAALRRGGLTIEDINLVDLTFPDMNVAMANKSIDVALQAEPNITVGIRDNLFVRWKGVDDVSPDHQSGVLMYSPGFAANTQAGRLFMLAYIRGVREYNDAMHKNIARAEIIALLAEASTVKDATLHEAMTPAGLNPQGRLNVDSITREQDWYVDHGVVERTVDLGTLIDHQFVDNAVEVLGDYE